MANIERGMIEQRKQFLIWTNEQPSIFGLSQDDKEIVESVWNEIQKRRVK